MGALRHEKSPRLRLDILAWEARPVVPAGTGGAARGMTGNALISATQGAVVLAAFQSFCLSETALPVDHDLPYRYRILAAVNESAIARGAGTVAVVDDALMVDRTFPPEVAGCLQWLEHEDLARIRISYHQSARPSVVAAVGLA